MIILSIKIKSTRGVESFGCPFFISCEIYRRESEGRRRGRGTMCIRRHIYIGYVYAFKKHSYFTNVAEISGCVISVKLPRLGVVSVVAVAVIGDGGDIVG